MTLSYATLDDLRELPDLNDTERYSDEDLTTAGEWAEGRIELGVGTSFVARSVTVTVDGDSQDCDGGLNVGYPYVLAVTAVTSNGVAFTGPQLAQVSVVAGIALRLTSPTGWLAWDYGRRNITLTLNTGYSATPPADVLAAFKQATRFRAIRGRAGSGVSDRATTISTEQGTTVLQVADQDHPTGIPEVDAVILDWRDRLQVFGFAV